MKKFHEILLYLLTIRTFRIVWLEQTGGSRDAQTVFNDVEIDSREIINPNGNMFCRMKFTDDYVKMLIEAHQLSLKNIIRSVFHL